MIHKLSINIIFICFLSWLVFSGVSEISDDSKDLKWEFQIDMLQKVLQDGKLQVEKIQSQALASASGSCYENLMQQFHSSCKTLDSSSKFRLALAVYNCQRDEAGFKLLQCSIDESIESCAQRMGSESNAYQTIVLLTHHVENMCYFVHSSQFQKQTSAIINILANESFNAIKILQTINKDHELLKSQVHQTLAEQMKAYREHVKVSESIEKMKENHVEHQAHMQSEFSKMISSSQNLSEGLESLRSLQKLLNEKQEEVKKAVDEHYEKLKNQYSDLSSNMELSVELSKIINSDHQLVSEHVEKLLNDQKTLLEKLNLSEVKQNALLIGQEDLIKKQEYVVRSTQDIEDGIKKSTLLFHELTENSLKQHESLLNIVNDVSSHTKDVKTMQDKILDQAKAGFQTLEEATQIATKNIKSMHENFENEFGRMYEFLHRIFFILSKLDFKLYIWITMLFYCISIFIIYIITSLDIFRGARPILLLLWIFSGMFECFLGSEYHAYHQMIRWGTVLLSIYVLYRNVTQYRNWSKEAHDAIMRLCKEVEDIKQRNSLNMQITPPTTPSDYSKYTYYSYQSTPMSPMDTSLTIDTNFKRKRNEITRLRNQNKITNYFPLKKYAEN